jgi:hypothetical protein
MTNMRSPRVMNIFLHPPCQSVSYPMVADDPLEMYADVRSKINCGLFAIRVIMYT